MACNQNQIDQYQLNQITEQFIEQEYYQQMATKYGADVAILARLRLEEICRAIEEEFIFAKSEDKQIAVGNELTFKFMQSFFKLLERDYNFSNMIAKDQNVRSWIKVFFQSRV